MSWNIYQGDVMDWARDYTGPKFHALLADCPYHLTKITDRFGKENSAPAQYGTDGAFQRASTGFLGKSWDGGDVAFRPETWAALREHLLPGAFCMAFASTRGWHRMAVAIEDGGFIFHPSIFILNYVFGSGFPKATNISKLLDKQGGFTREDAILGGHQGVGKEDPANSLSESFGKSVPHVIGRGNLSRGTPVSEMAQRWESYRYGGQLLKPATEPVIVFQNPYQGRALDNITQTGAGAMNIDAGRINGVVGFRSSGGFNSGGNSLVYGDSQGVENTNYSSGRWPSGIILQHAPGCKIIGYKDDPGYQINRWEDAAHPFGGGAGNDYQSVDVNPGKSPVYECDPGCAVLALARQGGITKSGDLLPHHHGSGESNIGTFQMRDRTGEVRPSYGDEGTVDRFFYQVDQRLDEVDPFFYTSKPGNDEKSLGLTSRNTHPTLKPLSLNSYLASMLCPPIEYAPRRLLNPFMGSGSEAIGGILGGFDEVTGIEITPEYIPIADSRLKFWTGEMKRLHTNDVSAILEAHGKNKPQESNNPDGPKQLDIFGLGDGE